MVKRHHTRINNLNRLQPTNFEYNRDTHTGVGICAYDFQVNCFPDAFIPINFDIWVRNLAFKCNGLSILINSHFGHHIFVRVQLVTGDSTIWTVCLIHEIYLICRVMGTKVNLVYISRAFPVIECDWPGLVIFGVFPAMVLE